MLTSQRHLILHSRFELKQTGPTSIELIIQLGDKPILNPSFIEEQNLSEKEIFDCEDEVLKTIAFL